MDDRHHLVLGQAFGRPLDPFAVERHALEAGVEAHAGEKHAITHPVGAMLALTSFTVGGVLARFPDLRVAFLEAGAGWLPFWLERLDEHWELMPEQAPLLDRPPSQYLQGRGFVSCEPEERALPWVLDTLGDDVVCYASDYCHWDCAFPNSVKLLVDRQDLRDPAKAAILGGNGARLYGLALPGSGKLGS